MADGLSSSFVVSATQDKFGFMWFATSNGLNRYDGHGFTTFWHHPEDSTSLSGDRIEEVFTDSEGNLWVGTCCGLDLFDYTAWASTGSGVFTKIVKTLSGLPAPAMVFTRYCQVSSNTIGTPLVRSIFRLFLKIAKVKAGSAVMKVFRRFRCLEAWAEVSKDHLPQ